MTIKSQNINQRKVEQILENYRKNGRTKVTTIQIILHYKGYYLNESVAPGKSSNALFGKWLQQNTTDLGISKIGNVNSHDLLMKPTTSALWNII